MTNFVVALFRSDLVTEQPCTKAYCRSGRRMVQFSRKGVPSSMSHSGGLRNPTASETNCSLRPRRRHHRSPAQHPSWTYPVQRHRLYELQPGCTSQSSSV